MAFARPFLIILLWFHASLVSLVSAAPCTTTLPTAASFAGLACFTSPLNGGTPSRGAAPMLGWQYCFAATYNGTRFYSGSSPPLAQSMLAAPLIYGNLIVCATSNCNNPNTSSSCTPASSGSSTSSGGACMPLPAAAAVDLKCYVSDVTGPAENQVPSGGGARYCVTYTPLGAQTRSYTGLSELNGQRVFSTAAQYSSLYLCSTSNCNRPDVFSSTCTPASSSSGSGSSGGSGGSGSSSAVVKTCTAVMPTAASPGLLCFSGTANAFQPSIAASSPAQYCAAFVRPCRLSDAPFLCASETTPHTHRRTPRPTPARIWV